MSLKKSYLNKFVKVTEFAAYGASPFIGKGDKIAADQGAVDMMRAELNKISMNGTVVIGEGEMDEAPMLHIGEKVGNKNGPEIDIALDPLEGTNFTAKNLPNAFSVIAIAEKGNLLSAPDTYMEKIVIGSNLPKNLLDLDNSVETNIKLLANAKNKKISELSACILNRPRHKEIINILNKMKVKINFITDGDIAGALSVIGEKPINDIYLGTGGGPEGVITAAALSC
jgi:fructose-1,6-bisphosphatase II / sedoheptulose-1,7-bisphosphatase